MRTKPAGAFATATVVGRVAPVSSHLGDRATIYADGRMEGFVGGACARDIVRRQALRALQADAPLMVHIRPDAIAVERSADGSSVVVPMTCTSEGAIDVFIEPHVPPRLLLIAGCTPVAHALARLASATGYMVTRFVETAELGEVTEAGTSEVMDLRDLSAYAARLEPDRAARCAAVAASQGHYDEEALDAFLSIAGIAYTGLLASRKRAASIRTALAAKGIAGGALDAIHNPIGLDLGAKDATGVAISILAELVATQPHTVTEPDTAAPIGAAIDPICGMEVEIATARHSLEHGGETYFFCSAGCLTTFRADPHAHLIATARA